MKVAAMTSNAPSETNVNRDESVATGGASWSAPTLTPTLVHFPTQIDRLMDLYLVRASAQVVRMALASSNAMT